MNTETKPTHAWLRLCRLCGCNYKIEVERRGRSVFVPDPHRNNRKYRIDAATFDAGKAQLRETWAISPWNAEAELRTEAERNWQT